MLESINGDKTNHACSIDHCPNIATHAETATLGSWYVTAHFCDEHYREMEKGTPLGGLTLSGERLVVEPLNAGSPATGEIEPSIGPQ